MLLQVGARTDYSADDGAAPTSSVSALEPWTPKPPTTRKSSVAVTKAEDSEVMKDPSVQYTHFVSQTKRQTTGTRLQKTLDTRSVRGFALQTSPSALT